ncbi:HAD family hydrolase [Micromonospora sp. CPCC 205561]|uniref:HAD family hydrolase n=1 Tax=Micromonospora sp. CPCC 205561 TaxID=3122407 RepID=UPI002FF108CB
MRRLALFDLDNTLVQRDQAFAAWAQEFAAAHDLDTGWATWLIAADARHDGRMHTFFGLVRDRFALTAPADELWRQYRHRMPQLVSCSAEDLAGLARLRRRNWKIGIVTNGMTDDQLGKIRNTGLDRHVDAWCISHDVGIRKPDPLIFQLAAHRCGVTGGGGWMVGDSLTLDIAGGVRAGLRTIWIRDPRPVRQHATNEPELLSRLAPDATVTSVAEAVDVLIAAE